MYQTIKINIIYFYLVFVVVFFSFHFLPNRSSSHSLNLLGCRGSSPIFRQDVAWLKEKPLVEARQRPWLSMIPTKSDPSFCQIGVSGFYCEKLEKTTRGNGEWEPIKIPCENSAYISNLTQHVSVLARSRQNTYWRAIGSQNWVKQLKTQRKY
jgi:hypothetical protein